MAQIILSNHTKQRALERGVDLSELNKTIRFPDKVIQSPTSTSKKHIKVFASHQVVVPIKRQDNNWITVSVWKSNQKHFFSPKPFFLEKIISNLLIKLEKAFSRRA